MWFVFALITALAWGAADLFYKRGSDPRDKYSHFKIAVAVGAVMGLHGLVYWLAVDTDFVLFDMVRYLPVSAMYIISMVIGYVGLRYIELSVASPVQNSSGALTALLCFAFLGQTMTGIQFFAVAIICAGLVVLAIMDKRREDAENPMRPEDAKYRFGVTAIAFPLLYCLFDSLGTFADAIYLDEYAILSEDAALLAYEFTFFLVGLALFAWLALVKKQRFSFRGDRDKGVAAVFETAGQFFYVYAMSSNAIVAAPMVASYSIFSILLSRIFLREKLTKSQYAVIAAVMVGIAILGMEA